MFEHMILLEPCRLQLRTPGSNILRDIPRGSGSPSDDLLLDVSDGFKQLIFLDPPGDGEDEILWSVELLVVLPHLLHGGGVPHVLQLAASERIVTRVSWVKLLLQCPGAGGGILGSLDLAVHNSSVVAGRGDVVNLRHEVLISQGGK